MVRARSRDPRGGHVCERSLDDAAHWRDPRPDQRERPEELARPRGRPLAALSAYARKRARLDPHRSPLRHRHQRPLLVDTHLLSGRFEPRGLLPPAISAVVQPEGTRCRFDNGVLVLRLDRGTRARPLPRGAKVSDVRLVDHALPPGWG